MKKATLTIAVICMLLIMTSCGMNRNSPVMKEVPGLNFYAILDSIHYAEESEAVPNVLNDENFVAYSSISGSSSVETRIIVINDGKNDDKLTAYLRTFNNGDVKTYKGCIKKEYLYDALARLSKKKEPDVVLDGGEISYGYLYYTDGEKIYRCTTENILGIGILHK